MTEIFTGAIFVVREHDMKKESLRCVLDCAHSVFNAVTGVTLSKEKSEIRGFRSVLEWRKIIENYGFKDLKVFWIFAIYVRKLIFLPRSMRCSLTTVRKMS